MTTPFHCGRQGSRLAGLATAVCFAAGMGASGHAQAQKMPQILKPQILKSMQISSATQMRSYDIPARDMAEALQQYGRISNTQLLFSPNLVKGRKSRAIKGQFSADEALKRMLDGTGLVSARTSGNVVLVTEQRAPPEAPILPEGPRPLKKQALSVMASADDDQIEDVIIISGKRLENIQSVPSSVAAGTAGHMERNGVRDFDDIVKIVPSMTITKTSQPANNSINIRGIGTYSYSIATEASVAVVIDDVPQAFQAAAFSALVDVQQVEVMRGPQNTLFGKSASAGVINITTQPATNTFTAHTEVTLTSDSEKRIQTTVSGPLSDHFKFRVAGNISQYRGNVYNLSTGHWLNGTADNTLRAKLVWTPAEEWTVTGTGFITRTRSSCCAGAETFVSPGVTFSKANIPQSVILAGLTPAPDNRLTRMDVDARGDAVDYGGSVKIVRNLNGFSLASISSYDRYKLVDIQDTDSTDFDFSAIDPAAPKGGSANGGYFKIGSVTQEYRLTSPDAGRLKYVAGLYFSDTHSQRYFVRGSNTLGNYNGLSALPTTNSTTYSAYLSQANATNYALFGQATYELTRRLGVVGGLRINIEDIRYRFHDIGNHVTYGDPECSTNSPTLAIQTCNTDTAVTGRASLIYHITPDIMSFATFARGYKGLAYDLTSTLTTRTLLANGPLKGIPVGDAVAAKQPIAPELVDNYELGFKSSFFHRRLIWNLTAFYESFTGFQAQSRDIATGQNVLNSIGQVTSKGVESELSARVGSHLTINASGAYNKATMDDFPNANCYGGQTVAQGCIGGMQDLSGKPLFNAPEWNLSTSVAYEKPLSDGWTGLATAAYRWQSEVIFNLLQDPDSVQKSYGVANVSAGVRKGRWKAVLFINNLFDKAYALTRGRETHWNISQTSNPVTDAINWKPARDSARYVGLRLVNTY